MTAAPQSTLLAAVEALTESHAALMECDRDGDYPLMDRIDAALSLLRAALEAREDAAQCGLTDAQIMRVWESPGPWSNDEMDPVAFARAVLAASPVAAPVEARPVAWMRTDEEGIYVHPATYERLSALTKKEFVPLYAPPVAADTQGDAQDAARYRWLRSEANHHPDLTPFYAGEGLDAAVDAAMKEQISDGADCRCLLPAEKTTGAGANGLGGCVAGECGKEEKRG